MIFPLIMGLLAGIIQLLVPFYVKLIIEMVQSGDIIKYPYIYVAFLALISFLTLQFFSQLILQKIAILMTNNIREKSIKNILLKKKIFFDKETPGDLSSIICNDTMIISELISGTVPDIINSLITVILAIGFLIILNPKLTLSLTLLLPLILIFIPIGNYMSKIFYNIQVDIGKLNHYTNFITENSDFIKENTSQLVEEDRGINLLKKIKKNSEKSAVISSITIPISNILVFFFLLILLIYGFSLVENNQITMGGLVAYILLVFEVIIPIQKLVSTASYLKSAKKVSQRIFRLLENSQIEDIENQVPISMVEKIIISDLSFSYIKNDPIINKLKITFRKGELIALIGDSGCGKSTFLSLLIKKYDSYSGNIFFDDIEIKNIPTQTLRSHISFVSQKHNLIEGTIRDNLRYGLKSHISDEQIFEKAKMVNFNQVINFYQNGLGTVIGGENIRLSEGEKQRLSLTRAFIKDSEILVLDEITSDVDSLSESIILNSLNEISKTKIVIITAHRLTTIKASNRIIFLDKGEITGDAQYNELFSNHNKFKNYITSLSANV